MYLYSGVFAASSINEGLVVASLGWNFLISLNFPVLELTIECFYHDNLILPSMYLEHCNLT